MSRCRAKLHTPVSRSSDIPPPARFHIPTSDIPTRAPTESEDVSDELMAILDSWDEDELEATYDPHPCQPIGCDAGQHLPGCPVEAAMEEEER